MHSPAQIWKTKLIKLDQQHNFFINVRLSFKSVISGETLINLYLQSISLDRMIKSTQQPQQQIVQISLQILTILYCFGINFILLLFFFIFFLNFVSPQNCNPPIYCLTMRWTPLCYFYHQTARLQDKEMVKSSALLTSQQYLVQTKGY